MPRKRKTASKRRRRQHQSPATVPSRGPGQLVSSKPPSPPNPGGGSEWAVNLARMTSTLASRDALAALVLCVLVAVCYFPAAQGGFIWDDAVLTGARPIREGLAGLWKIWFAPRTLIDYEGHYWPILYTTFWLEHKLWGFAPAGYHIVNVLLHAVVTVLLWRLLLRLRFTDAWVAWLIAVVFAVHPLHVESVTWVIGRKDILATLFYIVCCMAYIRFVEDGRGRHYIWALALYVLGLLSKFVIITLPLCLLVWHWWRRGRVSGADLARVLPFFLLGIAIAVADLSYYKDRDPTSFDYSMVERALIAARALWFYASKLAWPAELAVVYPRWEVGIDHWPGWVCLLGVIVVPTLLWLYRHRLGRGPLVGLLFFAITLSSALGFVDFGYMLYSFVADRYQYLAGIGVIALLVVAGARGRQLGVGLLPGTWRRGARAVTLLVPVAVVAVLGTITWNQAGIYRDNFTFYSHIISLNPVARYVHHSLGQEYQKLGRYQEALDLYRTDYRLAQEQPSPGIRISKNHIGMGRAFESLGQLDKAEQNYRLAVQLTPSYEYALDNLGGFLIGQKNYREALGLFQALIGLKPGTPRFYVGAGVCMAGLNRAEEALRHYDRALALDPALAMAHANRERLLESMKKRGQ